MPNPCGICGSPVRLRSQSAPGTRLDPAEDENEVPVCTDLRCPSNDGNPTMIDVVRSNLTRAHQPTNRSTQRDGRLTREGESRDSAMRVLRWT